MRNVTSHKVDVHGVFTSGGDVGFIAALIATVFPVLLAPLVVNDVDVWTFFKAVSSVLLGNGAVHPATGFEAGPVLVGLGIHLFVGALVGALFAVVVSYFDIDELVPVIVMMISLFGVYTFMLVWLPLAKTIVPALDEVPVLFAGWMIVTFAILLGVGIAGWRGKWDQTTCPHSDPERSDWMLVAHERAIAATSGTLLLVVAGIVLWGLDEARVAVMVPYLVLHATAVGVVIAHARRDMQARARIGRAR